MSLQNHMNIHSFSQIFHLRIQCVCVYIYIYVNDLSVTSSHTHAASTSCPNSSTRPDSFEGSFKQSLTN
jgi:hypothetical protein